MENKPALEAKLVEEFVVNAHGNLERVKEMLSQEAGLINATWDWGAGDFESALGGAGHMGRKDIANYLLEQGARIDIFVAAMLGNLDIVKAAIATYPDAINVFGPHGISLLDHANAGGEEAQAVVDYLDSIR